MPRRSWPALLLLIAFVAVMRAQSTNASLHGRITDPGKAVIVGANVAAINLGTVSLVFGLFLVHQIGFVDGRLR